MGGLLQALPMPSPLLSTPFAGNSRPGLADSFFDLASTPPLGSNPFTSLVLRGSEPQRLLQLCGELHPRAHRSCFVHPRALPLPVPFPQIFSEEVSSKGLICQGPVREPTREVEQCPVGSQLHAAAEAGRCEALRLMAKTVKAQMRTSWAATLQTQHGVDSDEFREVYEVVSEHLESSAAAASDEDCASE